MSSPRRYTRVHPKAPEGWLPYHSFRPVYVARLVLIGGSVNRHTATFIVEDATGNLHEFVPTFKHSARFAKIGDYAVIYPETDLRTFYNRDTFEKTHRRVFFEKKRVDRSNSAA